MSTPRRRDLTTWLLLAFAYALIAAILLRNYYYASH